MASVHCKACGKTYNYEENGCCPSCGAYNRPPQRERVDADGTVHHLSGRDRRPVPNGDKVCYEKKECHEKKVCFEDESRKAGEKPAGGDQLNQPFPRGLLLVVALIVIMAIVSSIASSCQIRRSQPETPSYGLRDTTGSYSQDWLDSTVWQNTEIGLLDVMYPEPDRLQVRLYIPLSPDQVLMDRIRLYFLDGEGQDETLLPDTMTLLPDDGNGVDGEWVLTFALPFDGTAYDGPLSLEFLTEEYWLESELYL